MRAYEEGLHPPSFQQFKDMPKIVGIPSPSSLLSCRGYPAVQGTMTVVYESTFLAGFENISPPTYGLRSALPLGFCIMWGIYGTRA